MEKLEFLGAVWDLIVSLDGARGPAAVVRDDLRQVHSLLHACWKPEQRRLETMIQSLFALGLVAEFPRESLAGEVPLPEGLMSTLHVLIEASREFALVKLDVPA